MITIVRCETGVVIMSAQLEKVMIVQMFPRGGARACACFVCEVDDENNRVSSGYVAQQIRAKVEIVGVISPIRFMHPCWLCAGYSRVKPWESILNLGLRAGSL